jgi:hypothetical protein
VVYWSLIADEWFGESLAASSVREVVEQLRLMVLFV